VDIKKFVDEKVINPFENISKSIAEIKPYENTSIFIDFRDDLMTSIDLKIFSHIHKNITQEY